jgi:hypothetical protein
MMEPTGVMRRRSRQAAPRPRLVTFFLIDEELAELDEAAGQAGLARGAFAAEAAARRQGGGDVAGAQPALAAGEGGIRWPQETAST